jgi:hypothetical protein
MNTAISPSQVALGAMNSNYRFPVNSVLATLSRKDPIVNAKEIAICSAISCSWASIVELERRGIPVKPHRVRRCLDQSMKATGCCKVGNTEVSASAPWAAKKDRPR